MNVFKTGIDVPSCRQSSMSNANPQKENSKLFCIKLPDFLASSSPSSIVEHAKLVDREKTDRDYLRAEKWEEQGARTIKATPQFPSR